MSKEKVAPQAKDGKLRWRRGTFKILLEPWAVAAGRPDTVKGWICEPFGIHTSDYGIVILTHLPTGGAIGNSNVESVGATEAQAKRFAAKLATASLAHWRAAPKRIPGKLPSRSGAWWRKANEMFQAVYKETHP